ncbi:MAG: GbsR/MarR family transcriptional regulator [Verrucomicrobiaceae bacterium]
MSEQAAKLTKIRDEFVAQWGVMGAQWGINRTMAQIHALLMTSAEAMSTDEVMEELEISRGNAHTNLKDLVGWGLVRIVTKKGERKEFFEAEKGVWEMFRRITVERKRREIDPALAVLRKCRDESADLEGRNAEAFHEQMKELEEFVAFASSMADRVAGMQHGKAMQLAFKFFS